MAYQVIKLLWSSIDWHHVMLVVTIVNFLIREIIIQYQITVRHWNWGSMVFRNLRPWSKSAIRGQLEFSSYYVLTLNPKFKGKNGSCPWWRWLAWPYLSHEKVCSVCSLPSLIFLFCLAVSLLIFIVRAYPPATVELSRTMKEPVGIEDTDSIASVLDMWGWYHFIIEDLTNDSVINRVRL